VVDALELHPHPSSRIGGVFTLPATGRVTP
jgi:hypothetical protein